MICPSARFLAVLLLAFAIGCDPAGQNEPQELVFIFQKQKDPAAVQREADEVAAVLSAEIGLPVRAVVPDEYSASVRALIGKKADVAYVSSLPFLLARRDGDAELLLAEERPDLRTGDLRTEYDSVLVTRRDGGIDSIEQIAANPGDIRVAFTSATSTSGYVFALLRFSREGILQPRQDPAEVFEQVMYGGSYSGALRAVLDGRADVAAVSYYTVEGESAEQYLSRGELDQLQVIARTPGVPTHLVCIRGEISDDLKQRVKQALLKLSRERPDLLADVYGATSLVEVDENEHVKATVEAVSVLPGSLEDVAR